MSQTFNVVYANDEAYMRSIIAHSFSPLALPLTDNQKDGLGAVAAKALIDDMNERGIELAYKPKWRVFDKDDESTWPDESDEYWIFCDDIRERVLWHKNEPWDFGVTFWMPIEVPEPPQ